MKNVLLLGDSIRLGYEERVKELLGPNVTVYSPRENCRFSKYLLWGIWAWMKDFGDPVLDCAHWNAGIWDLHRATADRTIFTPMEEYLENQRRIADQLKTYTPNICFATTIPGGDTLNAKCDDTLCAMSQAEWNSDVRRYNDAAVAMLRKKNVEIDDLYPVFGSNPEKYICEDGIHPNAEGYELLARTVAGKIEEMLSK